MSYRVKIKIFDGPFDLLLHLIKINEMEINDIPVSEIARQYQEYIQLMKELDLEVAGEFLVMAATLINIKARSLLPPREDDSDEEEIDEILSAKELMRQLVEYRKFKEVALSLKDKEQAFSEIFFRPEIIPVLPPPQREKEPMREDLKVLFSAFARVLRYTEEEVFHGVSSEEFTVEQKMQFLRELLSSEKRVEIMTLFKRCVNKSEMVATFVATLEICRLGEVGINQSGPFEPIYISLREDKIQDIT